ncbi:MAG: ethanolamine utilization protein EutN [Clostridiaceae bacterium]|jgi:ethanolamine utilization protein EutN|nr:ethanolamine utilization protein EutN [Clostridiaceae bacterium]
MYLGKVIGNVVSTHKDDRLVGSKFLIVKKLDENENEIGNMLIAVDTVGAGIGEKVLIITGSGARMLEDNKIAPIDASIVGIVDYIEVDN